MCHSLYVCVYVQLGYSGAGVAGSIRQNYEKYLYPYEVFLAKRGNLTVSWNFFYATSCVVYGGIFYHLW